MQAKTSSLSHFVDILRCLYVPKYIDLVVLTFSELFNIDIVST